MKYILFTCFFLGLGNIKAQQESALQIRKSSTYESLKETPVFLSCDSSGTVYFKAHFWYNAMPLADNNTCHWHFSIGIHNGPFEVQACPDLQLEKIYLFLEKEVFIYNCSNSEWRKDKQRLLRPPDCLVAEFSNTKNQEKIFLRCISDYVASEVD